MLIRNARLWPTGQPVTNVKISDVRITGGRVAECAPGLRPEPGEADIDAAGSALLPGLHDHHIHLWALASASDSVPGGPPAVRTAAELRDSLRAADASLPPGAWLRCVGYHESVAGPLDRLALDRMLPHRPVRVQHRTGALWMLNTAAVARLGLDACDLDGVERDGAGRPTGRLWRLDRWLAARVPREPPDLGAVSASAAARGVTGFTDATPDLTEGDLATLAAARADGTVKQRVYCMAPDPAAPAAPRLIAPGSPADLVLLRCPPEEAARSLASDLVAATFIDGRLTYERNALPEPGRAIRQDSGQDEGDVVFVSFTERGDELLAGGVQALVLLRQSRP